MLVRELLTAVRLSEQTGYGFGPMTVSPGALVRLCRKLSRGTSLRILELGGGQSTVFWSCLQQLGLLDLRVTTLEHAPEWADNVRGRVQTNAIDVVKQPLRQVSDEEWSELFANPDQARVRWMRIGAEVPEDQYRHYTIRNTFYGNLSQVNLEPMSVDVLVLDGPHGNGRSLAFPLFSAQLKPDAWVLINDFDHYPFLDDLDRVFHFEEHIREVAGGKRWVLVRLQGKK